MQAVGVAGLGAQLIGAGTGMVGNTITTDTQAKILDIKSLTVADNSAQQERQFRRSAEISKGRNIATMAASGIDITRGNALFDQLQFASQAEIEAQSIRRAGKMSSDALKFQSRMERFKMLPDAIGAGLSLFGKDAPGTSILSRLAGVKG